MKGYLFMAVALSLFLSVFLHTHTHTHTHTHIYIYIYIYIYRERERGEINPGVCKYEIWKNKIFCGCIYSNINNMPRLMISFSLLFIYFLK